MKVKLHVELDLPVPDDYTDGEIHQLVFDEYVQCCQFAHLQSAMKFLIKSQQNPYDVGAKTIYESHNLWGRYLP